MAASAEKQAAIGEGHVVDDHLTGASPYFVSQADSFFIVEDKHLPVHTAILAATSPVLAELFSASPSQCSHKTESIDVPLAGETLLDIGRVLQFLYHRITMPYKTGPVTQLCSSYDDICPILRFAHKWNMQTILDDCDASLPAAVTANGSFAESVKDATVAIKWAVLADQYSLKDFLPHVELALVKNDDIGTWQGRDLPMEALSRACLCRLMQGLQSTVLTIEAQFKVAASHAVLYSNDQYHRLLRNALDEEVSVPVVQKWRQEQENVALLSQHGAEH